MKLKKHSKYFLLGLFILLVIGAFLIVKPFIISILTSLILGYIFFPIYKKLNSLIKQPTVSSLIMLALLILILVVPTFFFVNMVISEGSSLYQSFGTTDVSTFFEDTFKIELGEKAEERIASIMEQGTDYFVLEASEFILTLPKKIISIIIMLFILFFVFTKGEYVMNEFKKAMPIEESHKTRVFNKVRITIDSLVYGEIAISVLEGVVATIGFYFLGVQAPVLWGSIVAIVALLPAIGPLIVWIPLAIIAFLQGDIALGIGLALFGLFILTLLLDMILKPKVLGYKGHIHPIIILLGVLGGLGLFGLVGLILGPVILVLLMLLVDIYIKEGIK